VRGRHQVRRGKDVVDEAHQSAHTDVLLRNGEEDGEELVADHRIAQALPHLVLGKLPLLEVELHEALIVLGDVLDQLVVQPVRLLPILRGDLLDGHRAAAVELQLLHQ
jgi:hypothetical protein